MNFLSSQLHQRRESKYGNKSFNNFLFLSVFFPTSSSKTWLTTFFMFLQNIRCSGVGGRISEGFSNENVIIFVIIRFVIISVRDVKGCVVVILVGFV